MKQKRPIPWGVQHLRIYARNRAIVARAVAAHMATPEPAALAARPAQLICLECQTELPPQARFCFICGTAVPTFQPTTTAPRERGRDKA